MEPNEDSGIFSILCRLFEKISPSSSEKQRKKINREAFSTLLTNQEDEKPQSAVFIEFFTLIGNLRTSMRFDEANNIESQLRKLQTESSEFQPDINAVLFLLLKLADIPNNNTEMRFAEIKPKLINFRDSSKFPEGPIPYGSTAVTRNNLPDFFFDYSHNIFNPTLSKDFSGNDFSCLSKVPDTSFLDAKHKNLFGALTRFPKTLNLFGLTSKSAFCLGIPELCKNELRSIKVPNFSPVQNDEGYGSSVNSPLPLHDRSEANKNLEKRDEDFIQSIWEDIDNLTTKVRIRKTWESPGYQYAEPEKPYLTEASISITRFLVLSVKENVKFVLPSLDTVIPKEIAENELTQDLIYLIQGIGSRTFVFSSNENSFAFRQRVSVKGLSEETFNETLEKILEIGSLVRQLHCWTSNSQITSFTAQAFGAEVEKFLQFQQQLLISQLTSTQLSLLSFVLRARVFVEPLWLLLNFSRKMSGNDGSGWAANFLEDFLQEIEQCPAEDVRRILIAVFCATARPFFKFLEQWMYEGVCCDPYHEFIIEVSPEHLLEKERAYWTQSFNIRRHVTFGQPTTSGCFRILFPEVLSCGKSVNFLKLCSAASHVGKGVPLKLCLSLRDLGSAQQHCQNYETEFSVRKLNITENAEDLAEQAGKMREAALLEIEATNQRKRLAAAVLKEEQQKQVREQLDRQIEEKRIVRAKQKEKEKKEEEERERYNRVILEREAAERRKLLDKYADLLDGVQNINSVINEDSVNANEGSLDEQNNVLEDLSNVPSVQLREENVSLTDLNTKVEETNKELEINVPANFKQSVEIVEREEIISEASGNFSQEILFPDFGKKPFAKFCSSEWLENVNIDYEETRIFSLSYFVQQSLLLPLKTHGKIANAALLAYFLENQQLLRHLKFLRDFLFLNDGNFGQSLVCDIGNRISKSNFVWQIVNFPTVSSILHEALCYSAEALRHSANDSLRKNLSFFINDTTDEISLNSIELLECFSLRFRVNWPHNVVLTEEIMDDYSCIFTFLLQLRLSSWTLHQVFCLLKNNKASGKARHEAQIYRQAMQQFFDALQFYVSHQLLKITWEEFLNDLEKKVNSLDDLYAAHLRYIQRAKSRLLLTPQAASVMKVLREAMNLVLQFWSSVKRLEANGNSSDLVELAALFEKFQNCTKLLYLVLEKVEARSHQPHLSNLLICLNFNNYYSQS